MSVSRLPSRFSLLRATSRCLAAGSGTSRGKAAVILSGCGVYDGSEAQEAVSLLVHLSRAGFEIDHYAPDINTPHTVNHNTGAADSTEQRSVTAESARITRGNVKPVSELASKASEYEAVFFPGGFGAAKNLSNFAEKGPDMTVHPDVASAITAFHEAGRPLAFACIAPVLAAKVLPAGVGITLGQGPQSTAAKTNPDAWPFAGACDAGRAMGASVQEAGLADVVVDETHRVVTTPAYMCGTAKPHEVYDGIGKMVEATMRLMSAK
eukprot:TRINITY_DN33827_c0_g1_i1.p1 TRINITY_DN33827_c0_g1~~TRINITY_DN33827_c0_g1_i1.p1  ORF type:complete len:266 (-),score=35.29 TRINITY_DN33827_c0_g1_i1:377-1174(-)